MLNNMLIIANYGKQLLMDHRSSLWKDFIIFAQLGDAPAGFFQLWNE
jgi:hypothetical protein